MIISCVASLLVSTQCWCRIKGDLIAQTVKLKSLCIACTEAYLRCMMQQLQIVLLHFIKQGFPVDA